MRRDSTPCAQGVHRRIPLNLVGTTRTKHKGPEAGASGPLFLAGFSRSSRRNAPHGTPLAGTHGRPRRCWPRTESDSRHQGRRHVAQGLAAQWTMVGADGFRPHPVPLHFTLWIDTLNRGARHYGHSELPQRPQLTLGWRAPLAARNSTNRPSGRKDSFSLRLWSQWKSTPTPCGHITFLWKNHEISTHSAAPSIRNNRFLRNVVQGESVPFPHNLQ